MTNSEAPLTILYFAWLRERIGAAEETVALPPGVATVADLIDWMQRAQSGPCRRFRHAHDPLRGEPGVRGSATPLSPGDEVAFFPPLTGG